MAYNPEYELYLIRKELKNIISEIESISWGVKNDFKGIGSERCANSLSNIANQHKKTLKKLEKLDFE